MSLSVSHQHLFLVSAVFSHLEDRFPLQPAKSKDRSPGVSVEYVADGWEVDAGRPAGSHENASLVKPTPNSLVLQRLLIQYT